MTDKSKLILNLPGLSEAGSARVRAEMSARFPQFRFEAGAVEAPGAPAACGVTATGPWHLTARERPSLDAMRMFGEGAAAAVLSFERERAELEAENAAGDAAFKSLQASSSGNWVDAALAREAP